MPGPCVPSRRLAPSSHRPATSCRRSRLPTVIGGSGSAASRWSRSSSASDWRWRFPSRSLPSGPRAGHSSRSAAASRARRRSARALRRHPPRPPTRHPFRRTPPDPIEPTDAGPPTAAPVSTLTGYRWPIQPGPDLAAVQGDPGRRVDQRRQALARRGRHGLVLRRAGPGRPRRRRPRRRAPLRRRRSAGSATSGRTTTSSNVRHMWGDLPIVVVIDDGNGYRSIYAHFRDVTVTRRAARQGRPADRPRGRDRPRLGLPRPLRAVQPARDGDVRRPGGHPEAPEAAASSRSPGSTRSLVLPGGDVALRTRQIAKAIAAAKAQPACRGGRRVARRTCAQRPLARGPSAAQPPIAAGDQRVRRQPAERAGERQRRSVAGLDREQRVRRRRVGRSGVDDGQVDRDPARLGAARAPRSRRPVGRRPRTRPGAPPPTASAAGGAGRPPRVRDRRA